MASFFLRTFGGLTLEQGNAPVPGMEAQRKLLALLAALAATGSRGMGRERLMALLWPESDTERARGALKQMLHSARRQLDSPGAVSGVAELRLDPAIVASDVAAFRAALTAGDDAAAVAHYGGPFLDGVHIGGADEFERWVDEERRDLARRHADALERLAVTAGAAGRNDEAVRWWRQLDTVEPLGARITLGLMQALAAAGDTAGALRQARLHETRLRSELGASPDVAVSRLAEALRAGTDGRSGKPPVVPSSEAARGGLPAAPAVEFGVASAAELPAARDDALHSEPAASPAPVSVQEPAVRRVRLSFMAAALGAIALVVAALRIPGDATPEAALRPERVAVALFENGTDDPGLDRLSLMISDWVTRGVARNPRVDVFELGGLYLRGRTERGTPAGPLDLARANGAGLVVAGNFYRSGDSLTLTARILDVANGTVLRSVDPITGSVADPLPVVEELHQRLAGALGTLLDPRAELISHPALVPPRFDAYAVFVEGQERFWRGDWPGSLPLFQRAAAMDTSFLGAMASVSVAAVGVGRCGLVDSVFRHVQSRRDRLSDMDWITTRISVARCHSDHLEHNRLHQERAALMPHSKFSQLTMSTGLRQLNRPAESVALVLGIDPARDLGWLPGQGRSFYWREVAAGQHALHDYHAERATAERMAHMDATPLAIGFVRARSQAALGFPDSALATLASIAGASPDPALQSGLTGRLDPVAMITSGWVMLQVALELRAHGHRLAAATAARYAVEWWERESATRELPPDGRFVLALALELDGRLDDAYALLTELAALDSTSVDFRGALGVVAVRREMTALASETETWLRRQTDGFPRGLPLLYRARIAAVRGDTAQAGVLLRALPHGVHPLDFLQFHLDPALAHTGSRVR